MTNQDGRIGLPIVYALHELLIYFAGNDRGGDMMGEWMMDLYDMARGCWERAVVLVSLEGLVIVRKLFVLATCLGRRNAEFGKIVKSSR